MDWMVGRNLQRRTHPLLTAAFGIYTCTSHETWDGGVITKACWPMSRRHSGTFSSALIGCSCLALFYTLL
jgi:hypothetical protein